jgi:hypothetical protein
VCGPLSKDCERRVKLGVLGGLWKVLRVWIFGGIIQRRGTHVSTPELGSRGDVFVFGGILGSYADLRREYVWGNWILIGFWGFGRGITWGCEEGGQYVTPMHLKLCCVKLGVCEVP